MVENTQAQVHMQQYDQPHTSAKTYINIYTLKSTKHLSILQVGPQNLRIKFSVLLKERTLTWRHRFPASLSRSCLWWASPEYPASQWLWIAGSRAAEPERETTVSRLQRMHSSTKERPKKEHPPTGCEYGSQAMSTNTEKQSQDMGTIPGLNSPWSSSYSPRLEGSRQDSKGIPRCHSKLTESLRILAKKNDRSHIYSSKESDVGFYTKWHAR